MTTKGGAPEPERPAALPPKAAPFDLGMLVDQLVKLGLEFAAEALPTVLPLRPGGPRCGVPSSQGSSAF